MSLANLRVRSVLTEPLRLFLLLEAAAFSTAAFIHFGVVLNASQDVAAGMTESVLALVLLTSLTLGLVRAVMAVDTALAAQFVALLGVLAGLFLTLVAGPQPVTDVVLRSTMALMLMCGLSITWEGTLSMNSHM